MSQFFSTKRYFALGDILVFMVLGAIIYGIIATGGLWHSEFHPVTAIDLSLGALPMYAIFSTMRGLAAYILSLAFTLVVGYTAAKSKQAEKVLIPLIDILQSIPVLGFLPGLVMALISLFPKTNTGLELVAVILVFTGQVWNMTFSFYSSLKSLPSEYDEACSIMGLGWWRKLVRVELPYSAVNLAWNSLMSMAGGWFFLSVAEAFTLGEHEYRIPGVGSYMAAAIKAGDTRACIYGVLTMVIIIILLDFVIWRPVLAFVRKFRLEDAGEGSVTEPLMLLALRESRLIRWLQYMYKKNRLKKQHQAGVQAVVTPLSVAPLKEQLESKRRWDLILKLLAPLMWATFFAMIIFGSIKLIHVLSTVNFKTWLELIYAAVLTLLRVIGALMISTVWAVPVGIWIGLSQKRARIAQPIIQVMASFPAPMLYPLALALFFSLGMNLNWGAMFLMIMGVQWYVLFNVLAGALRISQQLGDTMNLMQTSTADRWKTLYLPSIFPALVTGWITAAGGAWNASIVSEYVSFQGKTLTANGLGAMISQATDHGDFAELAASLTIMIVFVLLLNRTFWARVYSIAQSRFRLD